MEEIINSVMQSPENTNPNVLRGQLQKIGEGGESMHNIYQIAVEYPDANHQDVYNLIRGNFDDAKKCFENSPDTVFFLITMTALEIDLTMANQIQITTYEPNYELSGKEALMTDVSNDARYVILSDNSIVIESA